MYWLPIELVKPETKSVAARSESANARICQTTWLPCPIIDLLRLIPSIGDGANSKPWRSTKQLRQILRKNPALLLFSLSRFNDQFDREPVSTRELILWSQCNLAQCLMKHAQGHRPIKRKSEKEFSYAKLHKFFKKFLIAQTNKQLRIALQKFVRNVAKVKTVDSTALVNRIVGKTVSDKGFKFKKIRRIETRWQVIDDWTVKTGSFDVLMLLRQAILANESTSKFESRLQTEKLASMKQLAYGASHEINNPLANISTRAQTMLAAETDHEKRHKLAVIYEQAIRAHEMISDMMLFAHPPAISKARVAARLLLNKILHELDPVFKRAETIDVFVTVGPDVNDIEVDATQISVAIKNLIQNSLEAIGSKTGVGRIEVRFDRSETDLQISVWDNGLKIKDEVRKHLFDPFYSGREAGRGLGFGLSKVWTIARLHGGTIEFDDQIKSGTQFVLCLPQTPLGSKNAGIGAERSTVILRENPQVMEEDAA